jgi:hypothetical protein
LPVLHGTEKDVSLPILQQGKRPDCVDSPARDSIIRHKTWNFSAAFLVFAFLVFLVLVGSSALAIVHIVRASGNVVYADTWGHISMVGHFLSGRLIPAELFSPHNQNRPVVLNVILLLSAKYDHLNLIHVEYLGVFFAIITIFMLIYFCRHMFEGNYPVMFIVLLAAILLLLSLSQWENFLLPINIVFFSTITFFVGSILLLHRHLIRNSSQALSADFFGAILLSALALFSMGGGILTSVVNAIQIVLSWILFRKQVRTTIIVYMIVAGLLTFIYLNSLGQSIDYKYDLTNIVDMSHFILVGLGNSTVGFFDNASVLQLDLIYGIFLSVMYALATVKFFRLPQPEQEQSLGVFCLLLLGIFEQMLIGLGRLHLGVGNAASSRYATLTMISVVAALILLSTYTRGSRVYASLVSLLGGSVCLFAILADYQEARMESGRMQYAQNLQRLLRTGQIKEADKSKLEWDNLEDIVNGNEVLKQYGLSLYYDTSNRSR